MATTRSIFVCGSKKSGMSFTCDWLQPSGVLGQIGMEFFTPAVEAEIWRAAGGFANYNDYLRYVVRRGTTPNGVFGMKLHGDYLPYLLWQIRTARPELQDASDLEVLQAVFPGLDPSTSFVYIWREDILAQTVSRALAELGNSWHSNQAPHKDEPEYDSRLLARTYESVIHQHQAWQDFFRAWRITPLCLKYEDIQQHRDAYLATVYEHVGVPCPAVVPPPAKPLVQQRTNRNAIWKELLLGHLTASRATPPQLLLPPSNV